MLRKMKMANSPSPQRIHGLWNDKLVHQEKYRKATNDRGRANGMQQGLTEPLLTVWFSAPGQHRVSFPSGFVATLHCPALQMPSSQAWLQCWAKHLNLPLLCCPYREPQKLFCSLWRHLQWTKMEPRRMPQMTSKFPLSQKQISRKKMLFSFCESVSYCFHVIF